MPAQAFLTYFPYILSALLSALIGIAVLTRAESGSSTDGIRSPSLSRGVRESLADELVQTRPASPASGSTPLSGRSGGVGGLAFGCLALLESIWTTGYLLQEISASLGAVLFWNQVQFFGAVTAPLAFFWFASAFSGQRWPFGSRRVGWAANLAAAGLLLFIWSDGWHHLFRTDPHLVAGPLNARLLFIDGPGFWLFPLVAYSLLTAGGYLLLRKLMLAPRIYRLQVGLVFVGILIPWIVSVVTWLNLVGAQLHDVVPLTFAFSNALTAYAIFRYGLFDLAPIAYATLVEQMTEGVVVLDRSARVIDANPAAQRILDRPLDGLLGKPLDPAWGIDLHLPGGQRQELPFWPGDQRRLYALAALRLVDAAGQTSGHLLHFTDITHQRAVERQLQRLAITDPLTGILNRRHVFALADQAVQQARQSAEQLGLVIFDLDHFKEVNDTYGHLAGDAVLREVVALC